MTRRGGPPDALTTKMSAPVSPSARKSKAMLFPSGDQRGLPTDPVLPRDVSRRGLPPSLSAIQISKPPLRAEVKATCSSSGENCPFPSKRVDGAVVGAADAPDVPVARLLRVGEAIPPTGHGHTQGVRAAHQLSRRTALKGDCPQTRGGPGVRPRGRYWWGALLHDGLQVCSNLS